MAETAATPESVFEDIAGQMRGIITSEVYTRIASFPMLAHYTSFEAMRSIVRSKEFWFSRVDSMNDISEVTEGAAIVGAALTEHGPNLFKTVRFAEMGARFQYDRITPALAQETYALSLCEHGSDEQTDRLVMWRAYGHDGHGLCLVLRKDTMLGQKANGLFHVAWSPIEYDNPAQLNNRVRRRLEQVEGIFPATKNLNLIPNPSLGAFVASCLMSLVIGHKNPAFRDEREIRFIHSNTLRPIPDPKGGGRRVVGTALKTRNIFALPLRDYPEFPVNASLPALLDHVVIGPSNQQNELYKEVRSLLDSNDLSHVEILLSDIPYHSPK
jgi:hypothetical protein